ncbi:MAG: hypothetical protein NTY98_23170 [Verrucomicrobia bacterium]|nr:hypothetical protein [Verrucomicrobiota bacterium]
MGARLTSNFINSRAEAVLIARKANEKTQEFDAIKSIQTSMNEMAAGKTLPAVAVHQRLREL